MTFSELKDLPASKKIITLEIDIPAIDSPEFLFNYEPGIWSIQLIPAYIITFPAGVLTVVANPTLNDIEDIGSIIINGQDYTRVSSLANLRTQDQSYMYNKSTTQIWFHFEYFAPPGVAPILYENILYGKTTGFCNQCDSTNGCYFNDYFFEPRIKSIPSVSKKIDPLFYGLTRYTGGEVTLINMDGYFDSYKDLSIYRQKAVLKLGFDGLDFDDYYTVFTGYVYNYQWDFKEFRVSLQDPRNLLSRELPTNALTVAAYSDLGSDKVDQLKPLCYGAVLDVPLICVDSEKSGPTYWTFLLMDTEFHNVTSVQNVYINDVLLAAGHWTLQASAGTITISTDYITSDDLDNVSADFTGANYSNALDILKDIFLNYMSLSYIATNYNLTEWEAATAYAREIALYLDDTKKISEILSDCCVSSDVNIFVQDDGKYTARYYDGETNFVRYIQKDEWLGEPSISLDESKFLSSVIIKYGKYYKKDKWQQYVNKDYEAETLIKYKSYEQKSIETLISNLADAQAKSETIMEYSSDIPQIIKRSTKLQHVDLSLMDLIIGDPACRAKGEENLKLWQIIGINKNLTKMEIEFTLRELESVGGVGMALQIPEWATTYAYTAGDVIIKNTTIYYCNTTHVAGTFFTDWFTNNYWSPLTAWPGSVRMIGNAATEPGWLLGENKTVGDASSGADYAGEIYYELYHYLTNTFGGTNNWANHDKIIIPDFRGIYPKGAGTTDRAAGKDANGNFYAATLGTYVTDKMQGHYHTYGSVVAGSGLAAGVNYGTGNISTTSPITDGTNGTPRTGMTTEPQNLGLTFIIKY